MEPLRQIPSHIWSQWQANLHTYQQTNPLPECKGEFRLVKIRPTQAGTYEEQRIIVQVLDENGFPLPDIKVAFSYSTAHMFNVGADFTWQPPAPFRADIFPTSGAGQVEHIQGSPVRPGEPGGVTVYVIEPDFASDYVSGCGMLADHTGLLLTFQRRVEGRLGFGERMDAIEERMAVLEARLK